MKHLLLNGPGKPPGPPPTLAEFWPRYLEEHCIANRQRPSTLNRIKSVWSHKLLL